MGCPGHTSGFKHFLTAVDGKVDVGVKHDDPQEGKGEPYLPLYVSFTRVGDPTLHFAGVTYCLTRTEWVSAVEPSQEDRDRLVTAARERVEADCSSLVRRSLDRPREGLGVALPDAPEHGSLSGQTKTYVSVAGASQMAMSSASLAELAAFLGTRTLASPD